MTTQRPSRTDAAEDLLDSEEIELWPHQIAELGDQDHDTIIQIGGVRSGKTFLDFLWMIDRGEWDTAQTHAFFTYVSTQAEEIFSNTINPWLDKVGIEHVFNKRPPKAWVESWREDGIDVPFRDRYTKVYTLSTGLHIQLGTLHNQNALNHRGAMYGSVVIEEFTSGPTQADCLFVTDRATCGSGSAYCIANHRHTKHYRGNPAEDDSHWSYDWLADLERRARAIAGVESHATDGDYTYLQRGIGPVVFIPSRTEDNARFLSAGYIDNQLAVLDDDTANKRLGGDMRRRRSGRVYGSFSPANEREIPYDRDRTLYVTMDFNKDPAIAVLAHPLRPGEYPSEFERQGIQHVGAIGEHFNIGGMDVDGIMSNLLAGDAGSDGAFPRNFEGLAAHRGDIIFFGDSTSDFERMGGTEWKLVDDCMKRYIGERYSKQVPRHNPLVPLGVRAVNAKFRSASGLISAWVHPRCTNLIHDFQTNVWDKRDPSKLQKYGKRGGSKLWLRTHCADAWRYLIAELFPLGYDRDPNPRYAIPRIRKAESVFKNRPRL